MAKSDITAINAKTISINGVPIPGSAYPTGPYTTFDQLDADTVLALNGTVIQGNPPPGVAYTQYDNVNVLSGLSLGDVVRAGVASNPNSNNGTGPLNPPSLLATDPIVANGGHHLLGVRSRTVADHRQFEAWLGSKADLAIQFCEAANGATTWAENLKIVEGLCAEWAGVDVRYEWKFPLCSTTESLEDTVAGKYDGIIESIIRKIADFDRRKVVIFTPGWEGSINGAYPWSIFAPGNSVSLYISAFERVAAIARKVSPRFLISWCQTPTIGPDGQEVNLETLLPNTAAFDDMALDRYYNEATELGTGTNIQRWVGIFLNLNYSLKWLAEKSLALGKTCSISEWGQASNSADFMNAMASWAQETTNLLRINYFNVNNGGVNGQFEDRLSYNERPIAGAAFINRWGPISILTPATFNAPTGAAFSAKLEGNKRLRWTVIGGDTAFSIAVSADGKTSRLVASPQTAGVRSVTVLATDERGQTARKQLTITFAAGSMEPEAQFYINRFPTPPVAAYQTAVSNLVAALKNGNVFDKLDGMMLPQVPVQAAVPFDLIHIGRSGTLVGTTLFTANGGTASDQSTGYLDTNFQPQMPGIRFQQDDMHFGVWALTSTARTDGVDATEFGAGGVVSLLRLNANGNVNGRPLANSAKAFAGAPFPGHVVVTRDTVGAWRSYRQGAITANGDATASTARPFETFKAMAAQPANGSFGASRLAAVHWGSGLSDAQALTIYNALNAYRNAVSAIPA